MKMMARLSSNFSSLKLNEKILQLLRSLLFQSVLRKIQLKILDFHGLMVLRGIIQSVVLEFLVQ